MTAAVDTARSALFEIDRGDLAARVRANRAGWPMYEGGRAPVVGRPALSPDDQHALVKALWLGHLAGGHLEARMTFDRDGWGITCQVCAEGPTEAAR